MSTPSNFSFKIIMNRALTLVSDPTFTLALLGPFILGHSLEFAIGRLASSGGAPEVLNALRDTTTGGIVDYVIQFYTALLAWWMLVFRGGGIMHRQMAARDGKADLETGIAAYGVAYIVSLIVGLFMFFLGFLATEHLILGYTNQGISVGQPKAPLFTILFGTRIALAAMGFWTSSLLSRHANVKIA